MPGTHQRARRRCRRATRGWRAGVRAGFGPSAALLPAASCCLPIEHDIRYRHISRAPVPPLCDRASPGRLKPSAARRQATAAKVRQAQPRQVTGPPAEQDRQSRAAATRNIDRRAARHAPRSAQVLNCAANFFLAHNIGHKLGFKILYLLSYESTLPQWYAKLGWDEIGVDNCHGNPVNVMQIELDRYVQP